jgi:hypothetical protein
MPAIARPALAVLLGASLVATGSCFLAASYDDLAHAADSGLRDTSRAEADARPGPDGPLDAAPQDALRDTRADTPMDAHDEAPEGASAITYAGGVAGNAGYPPEASTVELPAMPAAPGDLVVVGLSWDDQDGGFQASVNDSNGNVYRPTDDAGAILWNGSYRAQLFYASGITASESQNQVRAGLTGRPSEFFEARIYEYIHVDPVSPLDVAAEAAGTGATFDSGAQTTHAAGELVFGMAQCLCETTVLIAGTGFTTRPLVGQGGAIGEDLILPTPGSASAVLEASNSVPWVMLMATFKPAP